MNHALPPFSRFILLCLCICVASTTILAKRRMPQGGRLAVVVDERLSALRSTPELSGTLVRRIGRGGLVAVNGAKSTSGGIVFYHVNLTKRTSGWIQREAVVSPARNGDDTRLFNLIKASDDFDRIARARIFLDNFKLSNLRPEVLMIYALAAEDAAAHLSRDASRRLDEREMAAGAAPVFSYFLNYNGLDRYNRQGITFVFNASAKILQYDGEAWQEILHRYPHSPQAVEARKRLEALTGRK